MTGIKKSVILNANKMPSMQITSHSEKETQKIAERFAATLTGGDIVCLRGELGAGKTTFVKGLAKALGVREQITSPTFTLMNVYPLSASPQDSAVNALVHIDTYRLKNEQELLDIGAADYLGQPTTITIIEWPEKISGILKNKKVINIAIDHFEKNSRIFTIASTLPA